MTNSSAETQLPYDLAFDLVAYADEVKATVNTAPSYDELAATRLPGFEQGLIDIRERLEGAKDRGEHTSIVIGTGGTFQSKKVGKQYEPVGTLKESFEALQLPKDETLHLEFFDLMNLDSSQMRPEHWRFLADSIIRLNEEAGDLIDSIVVTHGTDTMERGASYLSFALQGLHIPILITGSQKPAFEKEGDAKDQMERTLITAKLAAKQHIAEVMVVCGSKVTRGTWAAKQGDATTDAFGPWNDPKQRHDATDWELAARDGTLDKLAPAFIDFGVGKPVGALEFASHAITKGKLGIYRPFTRFDEAADLYPAKLTDKSPENFARFIM
ncbi:MAG TPA: asparaginase domain-containing protein, partial [Candidatus Saccharimonadales bacterium]|nr:asparaginase domain-containing protein [Candidatus Saccharimonadales bacterium]